MSNNNNDKKTIETQATVRPYVEKQHASAEKIGKGVQKGINLGINLFGKAVKGLANVTSKLDKKVND